MFNVDQVVSENLPQMHPQSLVGKSFRNILRYLLHEKALLNIEKQYPFAKGVDYAEAMLDHFDFGYCVSDKDREKIPATGRVVIIANHPIGTLDGAALIKMVSEIRPDFKVVANKVLMAVKPLHSILLPVNNMGGKTAKKNLESIYQHLNNEGVVIIFCRRSVSYGAWPGFVMVVGIRAFSVLLPPLNLLFYLYIWMHVIQHFFTPYQLYINHCRHCF
ncbi:hypothetical protein [Colwellia maritima]|uniref:GNAT family N-acetyltransferase n=1 Tax=Colwellia maritima TaxID=2912588 RepID=UPI003084300B